MVYIEICVLHQLESVLVELFDLAGAEAADEPVQCDHLCRSQLLHGQVVEFGNSPPHKLYLLIQVLTIREHHEYKIV